MPGGVPTVFLLRGPEAEPCAPCLACVLKLSDGVGTVICRYDQVKLCDADHVGDFEHV